MNTVFTIMLTTHNALPPSPRGEGVGGRGDARRIKPHAFTTLDVLGVVCRPAPGPLPSRGGEE